MIGPAARGCLCAAVLLLQPRAAAAYEQVGAADASAPAAPPLVLVFTPAATAPLAGRLEAELVAVGMAVRRVVVADAATFDDLAPQVAAARARGAIRVSAGGFGAEVWIADPATGRTSLRQTLSSEPSQEMESVIVLRTVEFLRASLLPAGAAMPEKKAGAAESPRSPLADAAAGPAPARAPNPPGSPNSANSPPSPPWPRLRFSVAPALMLSPGGVGLAPATAWAVNLRLGRRAGIEAVALLPLAPPELETSLGAIRVSIALAGAGAYARWWARSRWSSEIAAGAFAVSVKAEGTARGPNLGSTDSLLGVAPYARAGLAVDLTSWLAARADVIGGVLLRRAVITVADQATTHEVATWGRPFATALLGLQAGWL